ncbi:mucin-2-like [Hyla sarda]|uniref:mucin-2-like n=1 Tax=Hyla sarda TaxID=327740 RepID=UPI0024C28F64|nr:mucin-2-like [Hyla sarda]
MKISKREAFWQRSEREEERRKEAERLRLQEERINLEKERIQRERQEEEERDRRIQEKERMVEEQRKEQARIDAERRRMEKERWAQQQKEFEEEMRGRIRRSQSIEMAAEAAALVSGRSLHPRDFFRQQERSVSSSFSPPSTPSSPSKSFSGFFNRPTPRYQRSMTESILTPPSRSPTFFHGYQKRDSFRSLSPSMPQQCSPAFIFSKSPLPGMSPKVDSLPSFIPPPITATRVTPTQVKGSSPQSHHTAPKTTTNDVPVRAEYVTVTPAEPSAAASNINAQARPQHEDPQSGDVFRAELVPVDSPSPPQSGVQEHPNKAAISPTAIKATVSVSSPVTEMALTSPAPISEAKTPASPQRTETVVPAPSPALGSIQPTTTSAAQVTTPTPTAQISLSSALPRNKTTVINETALSSNSALSYEPKVSPVPNSLVSLLAPIPYTPYRTQRADSFSSRSSFSAAPLGETPSVVSPGSLNRETSLSSAVDFSKILEAKYPPPGEFNQTSSTRTPPVPVPVRPLNSSPVYQPTMVQATVTFPVFRPITSENSLMPQPNSTPQEIQPIDSVPESASLPVYVPAKSYPSYNQVDIPDSLVPSVQSYSLSQPDDIHTDNVSPQSMTTSSGLFNGNSQELELNNNQTQVLSPARTLDTQFNNISDSLLPQSSPVSPSIPLNLTEVQPSKVQADILPRESSPGVLSLGTKTSSESPINANNGDVALPSPISPLLPNATLAEFHPNIQTNVLTQKTSSSSSTIPTEISAEIQKNTFQADVLLPEPLPTSPSLSTESEAGPQLNNIHSDILLVQPSPEPPSITTERSSGPQLNVKADLPFIESLSEPPSITPKDSSTQQLTNVQADIPLVEPSPISSSITSESSAKPLPNSLLANIPLVEPLREPPCITTETSSGLQLDAQANKLLIESSSESSSITLKGSFESELHSIQANILLPEPLSGSSSLPPGRLTEPQSINVQTESLPEPPSFTTQDWSEPQLNIVQGDIPFLEPPHVSSSFLMESSIGPQTNDTQAESLPEPPSITTEGWSGPQLNIFQGDIPFLEPPHVSSSVLMESSIGPQTNDIQAESLPEPPSTTTEGRSGPQLNIGSIPFIAFPSLSPSLLTESSYGPQSNNTPHESLLEPPSITTEALSGQADIPFVQPLPVSSSLLTEGSSGFQSNIIKAESLPKPPSITNEVLSGTQLNIVQEDIPFIKPPSVSSSIPDEHLSGPQANITQSEVLPEPPPIPSEGSSGHQPHIVQEDIPLIEPLSTSPSLFLESSSGPQSNNNQAESLPEPPSFTTTDSPEPQPYDIQADNPLLESLVAPSIPTESSAKSQISDNGEGVVLQEISSKCASRESSEEAQENDIHAHTQSSVLLLPTEISTGHYNEQVQPITLSMEFSPISPSPQTTSSPKPCPNILVDIPLTGSSSASSSLPTDGSFESQPNDIQITTQSAEVLPISSALLTDGSSESQPPDIQTNTQLAEVLPVSSSVPTDGSFESQPNDIQTNTKSAEVLLVSSSLPTDGSFESQPNDIQTNTQSAEVLPISSALLTDGSSESQPSDIQTDVQSGELLSISSSLPLEGSSESQPNDIAELLPISSIQPNDQSSEFSPSNIQSDIEFTEPLPVSLSVPTESTAELHQNDIYPYNELGNSTCPPTEVSTESQLVLGDILLQESVLTSSNLPIGLSPEAQPSGYRSDGQSLESTAASLGPSCKSKADDDQPCTLVQESSSVPIYGSSEPQLNNSEADIPPQEPPPAPPAEAQPENVQTDLLMTESSPIEESSCITTIISSGPVPLKAQEEISLVETSPVSLPPSTDFPPSINNSTPSLSEESLPITIQSKESLVSTLPSNSTSYNGGKPNEVLSDYILPLPIPLLEVPFDQSLPSTLSFDSSPEFPLRSPSPPCEIVYAEKVLLVEDPHPGSPPINENFIALESVPTISPGELESTCGGLQPTENILVHYVLPSNNITVDEDSASAPKLVPDGAQLLHQQLNSNSSEALL